MMFSVIYSFDCPRSQPVGYFMPPKNQRRLWKQTEGDSEYDLAHLEGKWEKGKHRKLCAEDLTRAQFDEFVRHCSMVAENCETMGALTGTGWRPAISFNNQDEHANGYANAYVTPYPAFDPVKRLGDEEWHRRSWERTQKAIVSVYGNGWKPSYKGEVRR